MGTDPEPVDSFLGCQAQSPGVKADSHAVDRAASQPLELQGRMGGLSLEEGEVLIDEGLDFSRQCFLVAPESL